MYDYDLECKDKPKGYACKISSAGLSIGHCFYYANDRKAKMGCLHMGFMKEGSGEIPGSGVPGGSGAGQYCSRFDADCTVNIEATKINDPNYGVYPGVCLYFFDSKLTPNSSEDFFQVRCQIDYPKSASGSGSGSGGGCGCGCGCGCGTFDLCSGSQMCNMSCMKLVNSNWRTGRCKNNSTGDCECVLNL